MTSVCGLLFEVFQSLLSFLFRGTVTVRMSGAIIALVFFDFFMK